MDKLPGPIKWILIALINTLPFALNVLFYKNGAMDELFLFLPIILGLNLLNYRCSRKNWHYLIIQSYILVCLILASCASTYLYYTNISDDGMTIAVGKLMALWETILLVAITAITTIVRLVINKKQTENTAH